VYQNNTIQRKGKAWSLETSDLQEKSGGGGKIVLKCIILEKEKSY
jgi:hypothetical protein